jgi:hypothetical protein
LGNPPFIGKQSHYSIQPEVSSKDSLGKKRGGRIIIRMIRKEDNA